MKIYDSRLRDTVEFEPLEEGKVKMYVCGPTVYDKAHLGHGRSAVSFDVVRRYFEYKYGEENVIFVSNYTDIDDKMINRAKEEGISVEELADKVIPIYERDYEALGVKKPNFQPKATEHVKEIIELIKDLEKGGFTYVLEDGVYYDVSKFPDYGKLSGQKLEDLKMGARIDVNDKKKNPYDFVLWKFKKEGEPAWESPWGEGRPGWHIECSAMTWKVFGEKFDIHGGGLDLKFPHHECEIAQSCGAFGKDSFAKYWMHNGFIQVNNEKMSKSLGNFFTLEDIFAKYDPQVVRFMFLQTHYRNPINFSDQLLEQAKRAWNSYKKGFLKIKLMYDEISDRLDDVNIDSDDLQGNICLKRFEKYMDNDFSTAGSFAAIGSIFIKDLDNNINEIAAAYNFLKIVEKVLGLTISSTNERSCENNFDIDESLRSLIQEREEARKNKDFKKSDEIRDELLGKGIVLEDTANGTIWKKA